ncbi:hypothetical protein Hamer_G006311 [Homarus americanus]|uniref:Uncharacterized protein n=1 Tax=Homarus americanus TaxID=6706 RepID=A0A8J5MPE6_HOMAM|nr:hypothetical protein Hamer_G006311 [Homarus americanus]
MVVLDTWTTVSETVNGDYRDSGEIDDGHKTSSLYTPRPFVPRQLPVSCVSHTTTLGVCILNYGFVIFTRSTTQPHQLNHLLTDLKQSATHLSRLFKRLAERWQLNERSRMRRI